MTSDPITQSDTAAFWNGHAAKYAASPVSDLAAYERKLDRMAQLLNPEDTVLEIGCGTGTSALKLAPHVKRMIATDISSAMVDFGRQKLRSSDIENLEFQTASADYVIANCAFDVVFASSLLHLVDDAPKVLESVVSQLKPGGIFISKTVCLSDGPWFYRPMIKVMNMLGIAPSVTFLSAEELSHLITDAGLTITENQYFDRRKISPFIVARKGR